MLCLARPPRLRRLRSISNPRLPSPVQHPLPTSTRVLPDGLSPYLSIRGFFGLYIIRAFPPRPISWRAADRAAGSCGRLCCRPGRGVRGLLCRPGRPTSCSTSRAIGRSSRAQRARFERTGAASANKANFKRHYKPGSQCVLTPSTPSLTLSRSRKLAGMWTSE